MNPYGLPEQRKPELVPDFLSRLVPLPNDIAVFDADGTLWTDDVADDFTKWMIANRHISGERWDEYLRIYRDDAPTGCQYLLSLYSGMTERALHEKIAYYWTEDANRNWIPEVVESLYALADVGFPIWVVSGSPTEFLQPLLQMLPVARILGMDFEFGSDHKVTGKHTGISCAGLGKAEKLKALGEGLNVRVCAGNGSLDGAMMELAEVAWSVFPNPEFEAYSRGRGWPVMPRPDWFVEETKFVVEE
ncbi:MAG: hypothetical protein AUK47_11130 [Deltaproteobacteria bacterium CG2_30_63_29]|nr:MAG: hypothetical protein AUK47_11130 [Deltaproteobacteria bacterium CG2_30_63_29]PIV98671.1 MAG: hypothetical protein COW42_13580 [Deltaproteobacteria bacterium CG17_big_fil_post_rev_8_21_14_2_50_63_7]PJB45837.1 MAG: hypothetical protein CO108_06610 [Deltaproteobacteria bacterium CG_4_9_14_3_um_filter_63_12]